MLCPKCNQEIRQVIVLSERWQKADVNKDGRIVAYGDIEEIHDILEIEHHDRGCYADLLSEINTE